MKGSISRQQFGSMCVDISRMLTKEQKQNVLISCGVDVSTAERATSTAEFFATLEVHGVFGSTNINVDIWRNYPGVVAKIQETTRVPFDKLAYALADHFNEDSAEDFCGRFLSPPLHPREIAFLKRNNFGAARALFQEAYRKDNSLTIRGLARGFQECGYTECLRLLQDNGYAPKMDATRPFLVEKNQHVEEEMQNPLAATLRQQRQQNLSTIAFLEDTTNHYRNALLTAMDECGAWKALLAKRQLLVDNRMEAWVAKLGREWTATRSNNPSWQVLQQLLLNDRDFAAGSLEQLATALSGIGVDAAVANMVSFYCTRKDQQQAKSTEAFIAQNSLRAWLVPTVCDDGEADALVLKLLDAGVRNVEDLRDFDKDDLKGAGFNVRQANTIVRKMQEQKK
jgi:hypothetical protein